uniref:hypothetical protein n=1 Tax=Candidatus Brocadia sp. AMX2 TaxID=2293635 RepID=UPI002555667B|nr:hypothetical protein [Candidatus Brocadia sp. AMX2]
MDWVSIHTLLIIIVLTMEGHPLPLTSYLRREALKRYFVEYEGMLNREFIRQETEENTTFQKCFRLQTERLASCIQNTIPYIPFELGI